MDSHDTDSKISEDSEKGSHIIIISKPRKNRANEPIFRDIVDLSNRNSAIGDSSQIELQKRPKFVLQTPISKDTAKNFSTEGETYQDRNPIWVNSASNPTSNNRTMSSSFHSVVRLPMAHLSPQSDVETKHNNDNSTPTFTSEEQQGVRFAPGSDSGNSNCPLSSIEGPGVSGSMSRLASFVSSRSLDFFDDILNNFNMEVGTVASRVEMWRQR